MTLWLVALWLAASPVLEGPARVSDGDTLRVGTVKVRLYGIDAPEKEQRCYTLRVRWPINCGAAASRALAGKIADRPVRCEPQTRDRYDRVVARCYNFENVDLGRWMVRHGHAIAFARYSRDYLDDEAAAMRERRGLWKYQFEPPCAVRGTC